MEYRLINVPNVPIGSNDEANSICMALRSAFYDWCKNTSIIYVGMTDNVKRRMDEHLRADFMIDEAINPDRIVRYHECSSADVAAEVESKLSEDDFCTRGDTETDGNGSTPKSRFVYVVCIKWLRDNNS